MSKPKPLARLSLPERLNFLVTNRLPRRWLTLFMGWFSRIEAPVVRAASIGAWRLFVDDLKLEEAKKPGFSSLHECFTRELKPGARPIDPDPQVLVSPCDAVVGAFGELDGLEAIQAKGYPYGIDELLGDGASARRYENGRFVTLRLKSSMYHRFHAPAAGRVSNLRYFSGDTWNVNPVALKVIERLYCKNERVALDLELADPGETVTLVAVAAILVASVRLAGLEHPLDLRYRGENRIAYCRDVAKGDELGCFEHGSTIICLAGRRFRFADGLETGRVIRMGLPLLLADGLRAKT